MSELFEMGGSFMGYLTVIFIILIVVSIFNGLPLFKKGFNSKEAAARKISYIKQVGLFALIVGILGQMIGLMGAFEVVAEVGSISQALLAGGLKISSITTIYGMLIYILSFLIWFGLSFKIR
ncbi:MotA/TolQ/ExbB proton channel family protein [Reichenbachiella sp. MALMAid0571]|uniref:MotA/TolQ/ExbB proton channel family protein n=1 Tax=Reichenbachiella sp. MALMAid0571 TaxID=3143939 RepID=UPI0032DEA8BF